MKTSNRAFRGDRTAAGLLSLPMVAVLTTLLAAGGASAAPSITLVDSMSINAVSADGQVAAGLSTDGLYEACRWTALSGMTRLGRSSVVGNGRGGGLAGMSADGQKVCSSIISSDTLVTQGLWTKGVGWQELMPPVPADGGNLDEAYGSAWDMSDDGSTVVGLYWRPFASDGSAHASKWTAADGLVDLGSQGQDSRANGVNADGSVVVGWSSRYDGTWQPTVWDESGMTVIIPSDLWCEAWGVSSDGSIIVGDAVDSTSHAYWLQTAAMWRRTPTGWVEYQLGALPGTFANGSGHATAMDVNDSGTLVVGINTFSWGNGTGFVWTQAQGIMKADDYVAGLGITLPAGFSIQGLTAISGDGRTVVGYGKDITDWRSPVQGVILSLDGVAAADDPLPPADVRLVGVHPNPFNPVTTLALEITRAQSYRIEIFDTRGYRIRVVHDGRLAVGRRELVWDGRDDAGRAAPSGVYHARVSGANGSVSSRAMTLLK